jgi:hypothetical protein
MKKRTLKKTIGGSTFGPGRWFQRKRKVARARKVRLIGMANLFPQRKKARIGGAVFQIKTVGWVFGYQERIKQTEKTIKTKKRLMSDNKPGLRNRWIKVRVRIKAAASTRLMKARPLLRLIKLETAVITAKLTRATLSRTYLR